jgi:release factor glutamine methyltransferase
MRVKILLELTPTMLITNGDHLRLWRREQLRLNPGAASGLDWLLEVEAKLPWQILQFSLLHPERELPIAKPLPVLADMWRQHIKQNQPLQYVVGRCPWRNMELFVDSRALIPRQETELLVELALQIAQQQGAPLSPWVDLGCGSGCIALALALAWPRSHGWAVDISAAALELAATNGANLGVAESINWVQGNWLKNLQPPGGKWQLIISNPPYIPSAVVDGLEPLVRDNEPRLALDGGLDGMDAIKIICELAPNYLAPGGWLMLEHHHDQSEKVLNLLRASGFDLVQAAADLEGKQRFAIAKAGLLRRQ